MFGSRHQAQFQTVAAAPVTYPGMFVKDCIDMITEHCLYGQARHQTHVIAVDMRGGGVKTFGTRGFWLKLADNEA